MLVLLCERLRAGPREIRPGRDVSRPLPRPRGARLRAGRRGTPAGIRTGAALGAGFLFSYAAPSLQASLRRRAPRGRAGAISDGGNSGRGARGAAFVAGGWIAVRALSRVHPGAPRHDFEALSHRPPNLGFYAISGPALLGLCLLPLYAPASLRFAGGTFRPRAWSGRGGLSASRSLCSSSFSTTGPTSAFSFTSSVSHLPARGRVRALAAWARRGALRGRAACASLLAALLWNQIRYPSYGFRICPDTEELSRGGSPPGVTLRRNLHLTGARVVRLHGRLPSSFSAASSTSVRAPRVRRPGALFACLGALKARRIGSSGRANHRIPAAAAGPRTVDREAFRRHLRAVRRSPGCGVAWPGWSAGADFEVALRRRAGRTSSFERADPPRDS